MSALPATTDVAIVGAGPTGLALACSLAKERVSVILVDRLAEGANTSRAAWCTPGRSRCWRSSKSPIGYAPKATSCRGSPSGTATIYSPRSASTGCTHVTRTR